MNVGKIIQDALTEIDERLKQDSSFDVFQLIQKQLKYLSEVNQGKEKDRSKLKDINIGLIAIREFEESDPDFARLLKEVQYISDRMSKGLKL